MTEKGEKECEDILVVSSISTLERIIQDHQFMKATC